MTETKCHFTSPHAKICFVFRGLSLRYRYFWRVPQPENQRAASTPNGDRARLLDTNGNFNRRRFWAVMRTTMEKTSRGRAQVAAGQDHEVHYNAKKEGF